MQVARFLMSIPRCTPCFLVLFACSIGLSGCLSFLHPGSVDRTIDGSYDQVFQATLEVLQRKGFPMKTVDREEGRIVTGRRPVDIGRRGRPVEKVDARIEDADGNVDVRLLLVFYDQRSNAPREIRDREGNGRADDVAAQAFSQSVRASAVYDDYLDAIADRVRRFRARANRENGMF